ncbi:MAG: alpha/beta fold hydrolase [Polyangiaceae bacterium]|nr:alpha/beta fold hydrolase [Polyangiaceae bacterium]
MVLEDRARELVLHLASDRSEDATSRFDETMRAALPAPRLSEVWRQVTTAFGAFESIEKVDSKSEGEVTVAVVLVRLERSNLAVRVVWRPKGELVTGLFFSPVSRPDAFTEAPYVDRLKFEEKEVTFEAPLGALPGTISIPNGQGPFAAVVLVHGSGPHDRDGTVMANRPLRDIALGLSSRGVAVLRYEKRTKISPGSLASLGMDLTVAEETVQDAVAALHFLQTFPRVDPARLFVAGHSLGGYVAPRIAQQMPGVCGVIVLAGNARPLEELILEQYRYLLPLQTSPEAAEAAIADMEKRVARLAAATRDTPPTDLPLNLPAPYWLDLRGYDPAQTLRATGKRTLLIQGGRDYHVSRADFDLWKNALSGSPASEFCWIESLNHLFVAGEGKSRPEEYTKAGHVAEEVVSSVYQFMVR